MRKDKKKSEGKEERRRDGGGRQLSSFLKKLSWEMSGNYFFRNQSSCSPEDIDDEGREQVEVGTVIEKSTHRGHLHC